MAETKAKRVWQFVFYPESAPEDWRKRLEKLDVPFVCSPVHDRDIRDVYVDCIVKDSSETIIGISSDDGEVLPIPDDLYKKPHRHCILSFSGKRKFENVVSLVSQFGVDYAQACNDIRACTRYLIHMDHPEKAQYSYDDLIFGNGFDEAKFFKPTESQMNSCFLELTTYVFENHITEYAQLVGYAMRLDPIYFKVVRSNTMYFNTLVKSIRCAKKVNEDA